jgi:XRCC1 N terminal domain
MRKRLITSSPGGTRTRGEHWLDVEHAAVIEFTSEDKEYPVESIFDSSASGGWRAAEAGTQTIRLVFHEPQRIRRISLVFDENETARTQEFVLRWSPEHDSSSREIVRQQWNFSPPETSREVEDYQTELANVAILELTIVPDIGGRAARASVKSLRLG